MKVFVCSTILLLWAIFLGSHSVNEKLSPVLDFPASPKEIKKEHDWMTELISLIKNEPNRVMEHIKNSKYGKNTGRSLPNRPNECMEFDVNFVTMNDLSTVPDIEDEFLCQRLCALYSECKYFSFFKNTSVCSLKAVQLKPKPLKGYISGSSACCAEMFINYQGAADKALDCGRYQDCHHFCQNHDTCRYWNFNLLVNRCFLQPEIGGFAPQHYQVSGPRYCCFEHGTLYRNSPNFDIGETFALSSYQCQKACTDSKSCNFWSYNINNGICILKSAMKDRVRSYPHTSGRKFCRSEPTTNIAIGCEGDHLSLVCPQSNVIRIKDANYGRTNLSFCYEGGQTDICGPLSVTQNVRVLCQGLAEICNFWVVDEILGNPCAGNSHKYVQVEYMCVESYSLSQLDFQKREFISTHCQERSQTGQNLSLSCRNYMIPRPRLQVEVVSATVGETNATRCLEDDDMPDKCYSFNILKNVTNLARKKCKRGSYCTLKVDDAYKIAGGSCHAGNLKYMRVRYRCTEPCENECPKMRELYKGAMFCSFFSQFAKDRKYTIQKCLAKTVIKNSGWACCECYVKESAAKDKKFSKLFQDFCIKCNQSSTC